MGNDKIRKETQNVQKNRKLKEFLCIILGWRHLNRKTVNSSNKLRISQIRSKNFVTYRRQIKVILPIRGSSLIITWCIISVRVYPVID